MATISPVVPLMESPALYLPKMGPSRAPAAAVQVDETGMRMRRVSLESKGMELYRSPAGHYSFNVGVHSLFVYSVTQCLPVEKDIELRFALKQWMPQYRSDGHDVVLTPVGEPRTDGTLSLFLAF
jgi:hypothetical protein